MATMTPGGQEGAERERERERQTLIINFNFEIEGVEVELEGSPFILLYMYILHGVLTFQYNFIMNFRS